MCSTASVKVSVKGESVSHVDVSEMIDRSAPGNDSTSSQINKQVNKNLEDFMKCD